jgi:hypothetical protein
LPADAATLCRRFAIFADISFRHAIIADAEIFAFISRCRHISPLLPPRGDIFRRLSRYHYASLIAGARLTPPYFISSSFCRAIAARAMLCLR